MKINTLLFALAGGLLCAVSTILATIASMLGIPGFPQFTKILVDLYGAYGYSVSALGILAGAFWGFFEGFWHLGLFALIYNKLVASKR